MEGSPYTRVTVKELLPVVVAVAMWGKEWWGETSAVGVTMHQWFPSSTQAVAKRSG